MTHILILGATSDIAQAVAYQYGSAGHTLTLAARNQERLASIASDLAVRYHIKAETVSFEALDYGSHEAFYKNLLPRPDIVVCVFGYLGDQSKAQTDFAEAEKIITTNYVAAVSILNIVANDFEQRQAGTIIGFSSVAGDRGRASNYFYGSAKAAFTAYLSGLRNRLAKSNVQVLTVKPGFVRTSMTKHLKLPPLITADPAQVAKDIYRAQQAGRNTLYTLWMWGIIMFIIKHLPEQIFKRLKL